MYIMNTFSCDWWFSNLWLFIIKMGWIYLQISCVSHLSPSPLLVSAQRIYCPLSHPATGHQYSGQKIQTRGPDDLGSNTDWATSLILTGKMGSLLICHGSLIHTRNSIWRLFLKQVLTWFPYTCFTRQDIISFIWCTATTPKLHLKVSYL